MSVKAIKVNNYRELSEAIKKLYIDYIISDNDILQFEYSNGIIGDQQILSMSCDEFVGDFCESRPMLFKTIYKAKNFFSKISNGKIIKCNFPAIVCDECLIELNDISDANNYKLYYDECYLEENYSIKELERMMKKEMYIYLYMHKNCNFPVKKSKEEVISFIKDNHITVRRKKINLNKDYFIGRIGVNGSVVLFSKKPMNQKNEKLFNNKFAPSRLF